MIVKLYTLEPQLIRQREGKFLDKELQGEADEEVDEEDGVPEDVLQDGEEVEVDVFQGVLLVDQLHPCAGVLEVENNSVKTTNQILKNITPAIMRFHQIICKVNSMKDSVHRSK